MATNSPRYSLRSNISLDESFQADNLFNNIESKISNFLKIYLP